MSNKSGTNIASVHRFGDSVAVYVGDGQTAYLTPPQAKKLAKALNTCARSCMTESFVKSAFLTVEVKEDEK